RKCCRRAPSLTNLGARVKRARTAGPQKALLPWAGGLPAAIKIQHRFDRAPAHRAKRHLVPGKHDAVGLGPEVSASLVIGSFKCPDLPCVRSRAEDRRVVDQLLAHQRIHLAFGTVRGTNATPPLLDLFCVALELLFRPWRR